MTASELRRVSAEASVDPRTLRRYLGGDGTRELVAERIEAALRKLGLGALVRGRRKMEALRG